MGKSTRQPARPLSGLIRCSCCDGGMAIHDRKGSAIRLRCSTARESGSCKNKGKFRLDKIEQAIFSKLEELLSDPAYIEEFVRTYEEERRRLASSPKTDRAELQRALGEASMLFERRLALFEKGILDGIAGEAKLAEAKQDIKDAEAALAALDETEAELSFDPVTASDYVAAIGELMVSMGQDAGNIEPRIRDTVRSLISEVIVSPAEADGIPVEVKGKISALVTRSSSSRRVGGAMVAEEGFEPPTHGL
ncbi:zinc ribbon domain-containing protein [Roseivivax sp. THAF30]|uniref:zinc ribbon domain-containing protein n=1 Tax=Roseivivax sp. THAF30 TaxID=2587852 RepID=UPI00126930CD